MKEQSTEIYQLASLQPAFYPDSPKMLFGLTMIEASLPQHTLGTQEYFWHFPKDCQKIAQIFRPAPALLSEDRGFVDSQIGNLGSKFGQKF
jgi:hypothetical protein